MARFAPVDPVLKGHLERLLDGRRAVGGEEEVRPVDRHHARRASASSTTTALPLPNMVAWATRPSWSTRAASSSGTRWPSVFTHSEEMASR